MVDLKETVSDKNPRGKLIFAVKIYARNRLRTKSKLIRFRKNGTKVFKRVPASAVGKYGRIDIQSKELFSFAGKRATATIEVIR